MAEIGELLNTTSPVNFGSAVINNGTNLRTFLADYRRPVLQWVSVSLVDVESNTDTANQTKIVFPDGEVRYVTENTGSTNKYRRFDITATASFLVGSTEDSGLRSGISEAANTWYAIYAIKSQANKDTFILAGDTTLPLQANAATLNTRYNQYGWLYLGLIRNGDASGATSDILNFTQCGNMTHFKNTATALQIADLAGFYLANTAGATSLRYTYAAGTGAAQIPNNIAHVIYQVGAGGTAERVLIDADGGAPRFLMQNVNDQSSTHRVFVDARLGVQVALGGAPSKAFEIGVSAFNDVALGVGGGFL